MGSSPNFLAGLQFSPNPTARGRLLPACSFPRRFHRNPLAQGEYSCTRTFPHIQPPPAKGYECLPLAEGVNGIGRNYRLISQVFPLLCEGVNGDLQIYTLLGHSIPLARGVGGSAPSKSSSKVSLPLLWGLRWRDINVDCVVRVFPLRGGLMADHQSRPSPSTVFPMLWGLRPFVGLSHRIKYSPSMWPKRQFGGHGNRVSVSTETEDDDVWGAI